MIVKDEEAWIGQCLESVKGLADEMIVVDTGSSDRTRQVAKKRGAKVLNFRWNDDTSSARNFGIRQAKGDWILVLDADEAIAREDHQRIRELVGGCGCSGISLIQRNYTNDRFLLNWAPLPEGEDYEESRGFPGYVAVPIVRLFRRSPGISYERRSHEVVEHSITRGGGKVLRTDIPIHHYKELKGAEAGGKTVVHYARLSEKMAKANPLDAKAHFDVALSHFKNRDYGKAEDWYRRAIRANPGYLEPYFGLSEVYASTGRYEEAARVNEEITRINPNASSAHYNLGELYLALKRHGDARAAYRKALELGSPHKERIMEILPQLEAITGK